MPQINPTPEELEKLGAAGGQVEIPIPQAAIPTPAQARIFAMANRRIASASDESLAKLQRDSFAEVMDSDILPHIKESVCMQLMTRLDLVAEEMAGIK